MSAVLIAEINALRVQAAALEERVGLQLEIITAQIKMITSYQHGAQIAELKKRVLLQATEITLQASLIVELKREVVIDAKLVESDDALQASLVALIASYVEHVENLPEVAQRLRSKAWHSS